MENKCDRCGYPARCLSRVPPGAPPGPDSKDVCKFCLDFVPANAFGAIEPDRVIWKAAAAVANYLERSIATALRAHHYGDEHLL